MFSEYWERLKTYFNELPPEEQNSVIDKAMKITFVYVALLALTPGYGAIPPEARIIAIPAVIMFAWTLGRLAAWIIIRNR